MRYVIYCGISEALRALPQGLLLSVSADGMELTKAVIEASFASEAAFRK